MKRTSILLAALAILLAGCSKDDVSDETSQEPIAFRAGQEVKITASATDLNNPETRVSGTISGSTLSFTWESGDALTVTAGGKTATFTMDSGAGKAEATFKGTMPSDGTTFDASYGPTSVPATQTYAGTDKIPASAMYFKATGCTLNGTLTLKPQFSVLKLNLYGTGVKTKKIVVKREGGSTYTLECGTGVTLGTTSSAATPFCIVVPAESYKFTAEVYDDSATPKLITSFTTPSTVTFSTEKYSNMSAKEVKVVNQYVDLGLSVKWATCNIGASKPEEYGDYFAWGETEPYYTSLSSDSWKTGKEGGYCWQSYCGDEHFTEWSPLPYDATTEILTSTYDAATVNWGSDWRMPTKAELEELTNTDNCTWDWYDDSNIEFNGVEGYKVTSKKSGYTSNFIFLPAAGYLNWKNHGDTGYYGGYWSSSLAMGYGCAWDLDFFPDDRSMYNGSRNYGLSVRPVR